MCWQINRNELLRSSTQSGKGDSGVEDPANKSRPKLQKPKGWNRLKPLVGSEQGQCDDAAWIHVDHFNALQESKGLSL